MMIFPKYLSNSKWIFSFFIILIYLKHFSQTTDVSQFAGMADFTKESCQYFGVFNCKETCGLCTMCDDTQQAKDRAECKTLCTLGVDDCTKACEAGQERCSGFATTPRPVLRSKTVPPE